MPSCKKFIDVAIRFEAMRPSGAIVGWSAIALIVTAPVVYVAWIVLSDGRMVHPIDIGAAAGPWVCLAMSMLGVGLGVVRLIERRTATAEEAVLWIAMVAAVLEVPVFFVSMVGAATGIGVPP